MKASYNSVFQHSGVSACLDDGLNPIIPKAVYRRKNNVHGSLLVAANYSSSLLEVRNSQYWWVDGRREAEGKEGGAAEEGGGEDQECSAGGAGEPGAGAPK